MMNNSIESLVQLASLALCDLMWGVRGRYFSAGHSFIMCL